MICNVVMFYEYLEILVIFNVMMFYLEILVICNVVMFYLEILVICKCSSMLRVSRVFK